MRTVSASLQMQAQTSSRSASAAVLSALPVNRKVSAEVRLLLLSKLPQQEINILKKPAFIFRFAQTAVLYTTTT